MKTNFEFTLRGKDWFGPFIGYWVVVLLLNTPTVIANRMMQAGRTPNAGYVVLQLVIAVASVILAAVFVIIFLRIFLPKFSVGGKAFAFKGSIGKYIGLNIGGALLTIITLSVYFPWYIRNIVAYMASETTFDGANPSFEGKGGTLFKYYLLSLLVPIVVLVIILGIIFGVTMAIGASTAAGALSTIIIIVVFLLFVPFLYLLYKWYVNIRWNDVTITWKTSFWPSCGFVLGQLLLTAITATIYWPAAFLRIYRYFTDKTVLARSGVETGRLGFEGDIGKGYRLIWGQSLLSVITLGIYIPWAWANIGRWLLGATYHQESAAQPAL